MAVTSILNNVAALGAAYELGITGTGMQSTIQRLTTGKRINEASDDASGLVIANNLTTATLVDTQGQDNANNMLSSLQTLDGTLNEATNLLTRAAELAQEAQGSGADYTALDAEYQSIVSTFNSLTSTATATYTTGLGNQVASYTVTVAGITALSGSLTSSANAASAASGTISTSLANLGTARGDIGAGEQSLQSYSNVLGIAMQNQTAQLSTIQDANIANEVVNLTKYQILNQSGISALSKANQAGESILTLLQ
jgi:flagellin